MYISLLLTLASAVAVYCFLRFQSLNRYIAEAKSTGLPYVVVPFGLFSPFWALLQPLLLPLLSRVPKSWTERWLPYLLLARSWHTGYEPFKNVGADTYIAVSPTGNILYTCDPEGTNQLLRSNTFDKPADLMNILNVFGPTMTGTNNQESRLYRKITAPFFNEHTMQKVWWSAIHGAESALKVFAKEQEEVAYVEDVRPILARLSLYLLNAVCFDYTEDCVLELEDRGPVPEGHRISYSRAMHAMLDQYLTVFFTPPILLRNSFLSIHKQAHEAYTELRKYMERLRDDKADELLIERNKLKYSEGLNIADLVVGASDLGGNSASPVLPPSAVLGNIFIFMFAGHEANANTFLFTILLLACRPDIQRRLHTDIDRILSAERIGPDTGNELSYEQHYDALAHSMVGAVINESMRLFTVLPFIPKCVAPGSTPQPLKLFNNRTHMIPANTLILINTSAIHRHPQHWPLMTSQHTSEQISNPVAAFNPHYWLQVGSEDKAQGFLHPKPGTFVPFSEGIRGCLGKKFALVELITLVTRIFREHSVELAVNQSRMDDCKEGIREAWKKARIKAEQELCEGVTFKMSLRLTGKVPLSFVKRGEERFPNM